MPAKSKAQQRLMAAAEHGADFPAAREIRQSMTHDQMQEFASGSMKGKPEHVKKRDVKKRPSDTESHAYDFRSRNNLKRGKG